MLLLTQIAKKNEVSPSVKKNIGLWRFGSALLHSPLRYGYYRFYSIAWIKYYN